uniref:Uncharacterized protein n=1 Tax=Rhodnius prolixus TaxID=13249 RepID=T1I0Z5_RHOPR
MSCRIQLLVLGLGAALIEATTITSVMTTSSTGPSTAAANIVNRGSKKYEGTEAEARQDLEDNMAEASVASYRSVVIHHMPSNDKKQNTSANGGSKHSASEAAGGSRSESYFKFYGGHKTRQTPEGKTTLQHSTEQPKVHPNIRQVEIFREDEARIPQRVITNFQFKQIEPAREQKGFTNQAQNVRAEFLRTEDNFRTSTFNSLKEHNQGGKAVEGNNYESSLTPAATRLRPSTVEHRGFNYRLNSYNQKPQPPPGMTEELMQTLLQQEPQTFQDVEKIKRFEPKKKPFVNKGHDATLSYINKGGDTSSSFVNKGRDAASSFNVGYSIGFGHPPDEVVFGKPKDIKVHVNGQKSVWKQLQGGVEMSQDLENRKPVKIRIADSITRGAEPQVNLLNSNGQSLYFMNSQSPDIGTVPTAGKISFDHEQALTNSNVFDFSNAMSSPPIALPLQSAPAAVIQEVPHIPYNLKPKGRGFDIMNFYQSLGYNAPVPVYIPGVHGDGHMVQAIVIPLESLNNIQMNWAGLTTNHFADQASPSTNLEPVVHEKPPKRTTKHHRKPKDSQKSSSSYSITPITLTHRPYNLQREQASLNAILAQEMSRKNQRHVPLGLRPPPAQYS